MVCRFPPFIVANQKRILFVCTGNICRSPMAEGLLRHAAQRRGDISVASAGVATGYGQRVSEHSGTALREWKLDIPNSRSQPPSDQPVQWATPLFAMPRPPHAPHRPPHAPDTKVSSASR